MNIKRLLLTLIMSLILFILGVFFYIDLLDSFLPESKCILYAWSSISDQFRDALFFGTSLSIIPFGLRYVWYKTKNSSNILKLKSAVILLLFIISSLIVSYFILKNNLELRCKLLKSSTMKVSVDMIEVKYWLYVLFGIIMGFLANYFYLKNNKS
jgi:hypothetical protein